MCHQSFSTQEFCSNLGAVNGTPHRHNYALDEDICEKLRAQSEQKHPETVQELKEAEGWQSDRSGQQEFI